MTQFNVTANYRSGIFTDNKILERKAAKALDEYAAKIGDEFQEQIEDRSWYWPNATKRQNGKRAGNPRDIVDTGELRDSQEGPNVGKGGLSQSFKWTAEHAALVKDGYITKTGRQIRGRDWIKTAMMAIPFAQFIARRMRS